MMINEATLFLLSQFVRLSNLGPAIRVPTLLSCWVRNLEKDKQQEFKFQAPPANRDQHAII